MREVSETSAAQEVSVPASGRETFWRLVTSYEYEPDRRAKILEEIDRLFRRPATILVVDACGFTRASRGTGIVQFLALLRRLEGIVIPEVERAGGSMLAREADNFFALMPDPAAALECGRAILSEVARSNGGLSADKRLAVSIGIGHGDVLMVERGLMYGDEMNLVCKVGEDLAGPDEILLTPAAREALGPAYGDFEERRLTISGLDVTAYRPLA